MEAVIKAAVAAIVQGIVALSAWAFILVSLYNQKPVPEVVWGVAVLVLGKYGIAFASPGLKKVLKNLLDKEA